MQLKNVISREQKKKSKILNIFNKNCLFTNIYEYIIFINIDYFRYRLYDYWTNKLIILVTNIIIIYRILTKDAFKKYLRIAYINILKNTLDIYNIC